MIYAILYTLVGILWCLISYKKIRPYNTGIGKAALTAILLHGIFWPVGLFLSIAFNLILYFG